MGATATASLPTATEFKAVQDTIFEAFDAYEGLIRGVRSYVNDDDRTGEPTFVDLGHLWLLRDILLGKVEEFIGKAKEIERLMWEMDGLRQGASNTF